MANSWTSLYSMPDTTANVQIWKHWYSAVYYTGMIDDVMVIDKALSGIVVIIKDNPLKDFETFQKQYQEGGIIEIWVLPYSN